MPRGGAFRAKSAAVSVTTTRVTVFGRGYLGRRLAAELANEAEDGGAGSGRARWEVTLSPADITDSDAVRQALVGADVAINAAGKTGVPNVDWCEKHPLETSRANVLGPLVLASACAASSTYLLQLGSGCIFYGDSPTPGGWREDDVANPSSTYSRTKYAADLALSRLPNVGIARLRMPIDHEPAPRNLITKLAGYPFVVDVANSMKPMRKPTSSGQATFSPCRSSIGLDEVEACSRGPGARGCPCRARPCRARGSRRESSPRSR
jgi:dTDP-4-dehydrorhamnose reductase